MANKLLTLIIIQASTILEAYAGVLNWSDRNCPKKLPKVTRFIMHKQGCCPKIGFERTAADRFCRYNSGAIIFHSYINVDRDLCLSVVI